jgi:hypothetical protein
MANQYTKAEDEGKPKPKAANQFTTGKRKRMDDATKDKIRAEILAKRMYRFAKAKGKKAIELDMSPAQVAAAKILIERGKPALQSVEQVIHQEPQSEEELKAQLRSLLADPGARAQLKAMLEGHPTEVDSTSDAPKPAQEAA